MTQRDFGLAIKLIILFSSVGLVVSCSAIIPSISEVIRSTIAKLLAAILTPTIILLWGKYGWRRDAYRDKKFTFSKTSLTDTDKRAESLNRKLKSLKSNKDAAHFCMVGGIYLDIILTPISATKLEKTEWSDIDPLEYSVGGSTIMVGRDLYKKGSQKQKSYLYSAVGGEDDLHVQVLREKLKNEKWLAGSCLESGKPGTKTAITVHLIQRDKTFDSMFTHKGTLVSFDWSNIKNDLYEKLQSGGVLYISGYMKTNLCNNIESTLERISENTIISIDHGLINDNMINSQAMKKLLDMFAHSLIDIYFCTYEELFDLYQIKSLLPIWSWKQIYKRLQKLAKSNKLPIVTIVRGGTVRGVTRGYAIIGQCVYPLIGKLGQLHIRNNVGPTNTFNASILHGLVYEDSHNQKLEELIIGIADKAFNEWKNWTK